MYVNTLRDALTQENGNVTIDMKMLSSKRTFDCYSQPGWIIHLLLNLLPSSSIILIMLHIDLTQIFIHMLFAKTYYGQPICNQWTLRIMSQANPRAPVVVPRVVVNVIHMACMALASAWSIISLAEAMFCGGLVCYTVHRTWLTV